MTSPDPSARASRAMLSAEDKARIEADLRRLKGGRVLIRERRYFVADIESVSVGARGFSMEVKLRRRLAGLFADGALLNKRAAFASVWEDVDVYPGAFEVGPYSGFLVVTDADLLRSVLAVLDADPEGTGDTQAHRLLAEWEHADPARPKFHEPPGANPLPQKRRVKAKGGSQIESDLRRLKGVRQNEKGPT